MNPNVMFYPHLFDSLCLNPSASYPLACPSLPPRAGKYDLQLVVMSDCYVGCDRTIPIKLKVYPVTRATLEGREARSQSTKAAQQWDDSEDEDEAADKGSKGAWCGRPCGSKRGLE